MTKIALRILVVEDEAILAMELEASLCEAGYEVVGVAASSRAAKALASSVQADLALVDIQLCDGVTGVNVAEFITQSTNTSVVFMSANPKMIPYDFAGAVGMIAKPYTLCGLLSAVNYLSPVLKKTSRSLNPPLSLVLAPGFLDSIS